MSRDTRRAELRERLEAAYKVQGPSHLFHESSAYAGDCLCGMPEAHPIHVNQELNPRTATVQVGEYTGPGAMVALFPSAEVARQLVIKGGEPADQLHLTLAYVANSDGSLDIEVLRHVVERFAATHGQTLAGEISGLGVFSGPGGSVTYASVDLPGLPQFRQDLVAALTAAGIEVAANHGYTPHITLAFEDKRNVLVPNIPVSFDAVTVSQSDTRTTYSLTSAEEPEEARKKPAHGKHHFVPSSSLRGVGYYGGGLCAACGRSETDPDHDGDIDAPGDTEPEAAAGGGSSGTVDDNSPPSPDPSPDVDPKQAEGPHEYRSPAGETDYEGEYPPCEICQQDKNALIHGGTDTEDLIDSGTVVTAAPKMTPQIKYLSSVPNAESIGAPVRAFVSEIGGHTLVTGPASTFVHQWETALSPNPHMMWMEGRLVGAEKANRNGAFWSAGDLQMGEPTVKFGPLNWLHESRHVIGVLADTRFNSNESASVGLQEPYIQAAAGIWRWIYPDEAQVIEQASEAERLWLSMECISAQVECVGENSCGAIASYSDYTHQMGDACRHMAERSATRRFVNPTFLGSAVIVPPVRPGWADADARVMQQAAQMAEVAFDAAGSPDISASDWEMMMGSLVLYGESL